MKDGWDRYATEKRYKQKGYLRKYSNGGESRQACETSSCDSILSCEKKEEIDLPIELYGKVVLLNEQVVYVGKKDDREEREENSNQRRESDIGRRDSPTQPESCEGVELAMPTFPRKPSRKGRKARSD